MKGYSINEDLISDMGSRTTIKFKRGHFYVVKNIISNFNGKGKRFIEYAVISDLSKYDELWDSADSFKDAVKRCNRYSSAYTFKIKFDYPTGAFSPSALTEMVYLE